MKPIEVDDVMTSKAEIVVHKHVARVRELLGWFACDLIRRGDVHDESKFKPEELGPLQQMQDLVEAEGQAPYGSDEYKRRLAMLKPMLDHHYALNSHHPEHYEDGVAGMDLFDLVEMFCDWKAASERGEEPAIALTACGEKYALPEMLQSILRNTAERRGWAWR